MDKVIVLAYDLGAVLIILSLLWRAVCGKGRGKHHLRQLFKD